MNERTTSESGNGREVDYPTGFQAIAQVAALRLLHDCRVGSDGKRRWVYCAECRQEWPCKTMALVEALGVGAAFPGPYHVYDLPNGAQFIRHGYPLTGEWYSDGGTFEQADMDWEHNGGSVDIYAYEDRRNRQPEAARAPLPRPRSVS